MTHRRMTRAIVLLLPFFLLAGGLFPDCRPAVSLAAEEGGKGSDKSEYLIGMGDVLEINVWNEDELSKEVFVRLDGRISLPLVGDVPASGYTPTALAALLADSFNKFVSEPSVSVIVKESKSKRYYIVGQIGKPGEWPIEHPITILQAIARAGGFLEWAKGSKIQIIRQTEGKGKVLTFDYEALAEKSDLSQNIMVEPGDTIIVP